MCIFFSIYLLFEIVYKSSTFFLIKQIFLYLFLYFLQFYFVNSFISLNSFIIQILILIRYIMKNRLN